MAYISYGELNSLLETSFIAGTDFTMTFTVYAENGITPLDLGGATITWKLCPYGQPSYVALSLSGTITGINTFTVAIPHASTISLSGKYIQQPLITDFSGQTFRPAQGTIVILPAIN